MPFKTELDNVYFAIERIGENLNCKVNRGDDLQISDKISDKILTYLIDSDLIIADISYHSPNVFLEVGYALAEGKEILLIAKSGENLPFDIQDYKVVAYADPTNIKNLLKFLEEPIKEALKRSSKQALLNKPLFEMVKSLRDVDYQESLYFKLFEFHLDEIVKDLRSWINGKMEVGPRETVIKGMQIFHNLKYGGFATYLVPIEGYWGVNQEYMEASRKTAKKEGITIIRVYILPTYESLFSEELEKNILKDEENNIKTYVAFYKEIPKVAIRDFGIWDDEVLCLIDTIDIEEAKSEVRGCLFSKDQSDLNNAKYWKNEILKYSYEGKEIIERTKEISHEKHFLLKTIKLSETYSKMFCKGSYIDKNSCAWYHGSWQYLRILNLVSTPFWHNDFYKLNIKREINTKNVDKILISGTADYAMLQHVHEALKDHNNIEIYILDICRTPLEICRWYRDIYMKNFTVIFLDKDIFKTDFKDEIFDIIVTDAFLTRFHEEDRKKIIGEWWRILKHNGVVITSIRLNANDEEVPIKGKKIDVDYYTQKTRKRLQQFGLLLKPIEKSIINKSKIYAENIISYPLSNENEIQELFNNFNLEINVSKTEGELIDQTIYAKTVARKKL